MSEYVVPHPLGSAIVGALGLVALAGTLDMILPAEEACIAERTTATLEAPASACASDGAHDRDEGPPED